MPCDCKEKGQECKMVECWGSEDHDKYCLCEGTAMLCEKSTFFFSCYCGRCEVEATCIENAELSCECMDDYEE